MKNLMLSVLLAYSLVSFSQMPMNTAELKEGISMSQVDGISTDGIYRYYEKGSSEPYTGVLYGTYESGNISSWQQYIDGIGQGEWMNFYENGNPKEIANYEQNKVEGPVKKFYENGQLKAEGTYKDWRIRINKWKYYDTSGNLEKEEDYGEQGSIMEVQDYYDRGEISLSWYTSILSQNGFKS